MDGVSGRVKAEAAAADGNEYKIYGYPVKFPSGRKPFPAQLSVISKVLQALHDRKNALLESPTGTGKTLALLSSTLAYQASFAAGTTEEVVRDLFTMEPTGTEQAPQLARRVPRVFYCTRTHSQLKQIAKEFRNCHPAYTASPAMCVLGSRDHLCISPDAKAEAKSGPRPLAEVCLEHREAHKCRYMKQMKQSDRVADALEAQGIWDIEDAVEVGRAQRGCPYYATKTLFERASYVLSPYNYILDPSIRKTMSLNIKNAIIIFDEAHNIEDIAREGASMDMVQSTLTAAVVELEKLIQAQPSYHYCGKLVALVRGLQGWIEEMAEPLFAPSAAPSKSFAAPDRGTQMRAGAWGQSRSRRQEMEESECIWDGEEFLHIWETRFGVNASSLLVYESLLEKLTKEQEEAKEAMAQMRMAGEEGVVPAGAADLEAKVARVISTGTLSFLARYILILGFMLKNGQAHANDFRVVVKKIDEHDLPKRGDAKRRKSGDSAVVESRQLRPVTFHIWCMTAAVVFEDIVATTHSIILTSGTLSPLDAFAAELGTPFPVKLEANHVINLSKQLFAGCFGSLFDQSLSSTYQHQQSDAYLDLIGRALNMVVRLTPGGVLMFVPSYRLLQRLQERWAASGLLEELRREALSKVYFEPRDTPSMNKMLVQYYGDLATVDSRAAMVAVCRGKVSEGINFTDHYARAVVMVGIPFPALFDLQVHLKKKYQDQKHAQLLCAQQLHQQQQQQVTQATQSQPQPSTQGQSRGPPSTLYYTPHKVPPPPPSIAASDPTPGSTAAPATVLCNDGNMWYKQQAFRAINQAIGRCIRHKDDFGAILLLDPRFAQDNVVQYLSRWMRQDTKYFNGLEEVILDMQLFFRQHDSYGKLRENPAQFQSASTEDEGEEAELEDAGRGAKIRPKKRDATTPAAAAPAADGARGSTRASISDMFRQMAAAKPVGKVSPLADYTTPTGSEAPASTVQHEELDDPAIRLQAPCPPSPSPSPSSSSSSFSGRAELLRMLSAAWYDHTLPHKCGEWEVEIPRRLKTLRRMWVDGLTVTPETLTVNGWSRSVIGSVHGASEQEDGLLAMNLTPNESCSFPWVDVSPTQAVQIAKALALLEIAVVEEWSAEDQVVYQLVLVSEDSSRATGSPWASPQSAVRARRYRLLAAKIIATGPDTHSTWLYQSFVRLAMLAEGGVEFIGR